MWLVHNYIGIFVLVGLLFSLFTFLLHTEHMMTMENYSQLFIVISSAPSVRASTFWPNGLVTSVWGWGFDPCKEQSVSPVCQISFQACCWVFSLGILVPPPAPLHNMWYQFLGLLSFFIWVLLLSSPFGKGPFTCILKTFTSLINMMTDR